jgi:hypothetical protein
VVSPHRASLPPVFINELNRSSRPVAPTLFGTVTLLDHQRATSGDTLLDSTPHTVYVHYQSLIGGFLHARAQRPGQDHLSNWTNIACTTGWVCLELIFAQPLGDGTPTLDIARVYVFDGGAIATDYPHGDRHEVLVCQCGSELERINDVPV